MVVNELNVFETVKTEPSAQITCDGIVKCKKIECNDIKSNNISFNALLNLLITKNIITYDEIIECSDSIDVMDKIKE